MAALPLPLRVTREGCSRGSHTLSLLFLPRELLSWTGQEMGADTGFAVLAFGAVLVLSRYGCLGPWGHGDGRGLPGGGGIRAGLENWMPFVN